MPRYYIISVKIVYPHIRFDMYNTTFTDALAKLLVCVLDIVCSVDLVVWR